MTIRINRTKITIRPSAIDSFYQCSYQWGKTFLEGISSIPNSRAAIGTSIHKAAEVFWTDAMQSGDKDPNYSKLADASMEAWKEEAQKGMRFGDNETEGTCASEILKGTEVFVEEIAPFAQIPQAVEKYFEIPIKHDLIANLGGTVDYITKTTIADLKTGKRKASPASYSTQQSIYKMLAQANGVDVKTNLIQNVIFTKVPKGEILSMPTDIPQAKLLVNGMLDTLDLVLKDVAPIETILRGNPKYHFCGERFCAHYNTCPFISGEEAPAETAKVNL